MGRLIDADDLIKRIAQIHGNLNTKNVGQAIDDVPDATPRQRFLIDEDGKITPLSERKKGEWIDIGDYCICNQCWHTEQQFNGVEPIPLHTPFCAICGADMRGEGR